MCKHRARPSPPRGRLLPQPQCPCDFPRRPRQTSHTCPVRTSKHAIPGIARRSPRTTLWDRSRSTITVSARCLPSFDPSRPLSHTSCAVYTGLLQSTPRRKRRKKNHPRAHHIILCVYKTLKTVCIKQCVIHMDLLNQNKVYLRVVVKRARRRRSDMPGLRSRVQSPEPFSWSG